MARTTTAPLDTGDMFPDMTFEFIDGTKRSIPVDGWTVVLVYRGEW